MHQRSDIPVDHNENTILDDNNEVGDSNSEAEVASSTINFKIYIRFIVVLQFPWLLFTIKWIIISWNLITKMNKGSSFYSDGIYFIASARERTKCFYIRLINIF